MTRQLLAGLTCLGLTAPVAAQERWFLMARHGECAEIGTLKRKVPDLGEATDPDAFVRHMRRNGYEVTSTRVPVPNGKAQEVKVPRAELFLLFVTPDLCREFSPARR